LKQYWTIKPYHFIDPSNTKQELSNPLSCLLAIISGDALTIFIGDKKFDRENQIDPKNILAKAPFDARGVDGTVGNAIYKLPLMITGLNNALAFVKSKGLTGSGEKFEKDFCKQISSNASVMKTKTLLIVDNLKHCGGGGPIQINSKDANYGCNATNVIPEIMKNYPFKYQYISIDSLTMLINKQDKDYCLFLPCLGNSRYIAVFDLETLSPVYIIRHFFSGYPLYMKNNNFVMEENITELIKVINGEDIDW